MKILVCGGRTFADYPAIESVLDRVHAKHGITCIIEGDASGVDKLAGQWADSHGIQKEVYPADWKKHGKGAGPIRNKQMIDEGKPDAVVAFPGGVGTANMMLQAQKAGIVVYQPIRKSD